VFDVQASNKASTSSFPPGTVRSCNNGDVRLLLAGDYSVSKQRGSLARKPIPEGTVCVVADDYRKGYHGYASDEYDGEIEGEPAGEPVYADVREIRTKKRRAPAPPTQSASRSSFFAHSQKVQLTGLPPSSFATLCTYSVQTYRYTRGLDDIKSLTSWL
jgi:hypothetical protein